MDLVISRVAFLGPTGTFTEEALLTQPDLAAATLTAYPTITEVLDAVARGDVDAGFVPIENGIEGTVNETIDRLIFNFDLIIEREVVLDVHLQLVARAGTSLDQVTRIYSHPHALAQCRGFFGSSLGEVELITSASTADAARYIAESGEPGEAALSPALAASIYGLTIIERDIEDHDRNQTRFLCVRRDQIATHTGHDRTSIVCFQDADRPGSLYAILGQFAKRDINLTNVQSRPTKEGLGNYCFVIDFEGHRSDAVIAECLAALGEYVASIKFLGSYPVAAIAAKG
jgi:prephenate dehydratase